MRFDLPASRAAAPRGRRLHYFTRTSTWSTACACVRDYCTTQQPFFSPSPSATAHQQRTPRTHAIPPTPRCLLRRLLLLLLLLLLTSWRRHQRKATPWGSWRPPPLDAASPLPRASGAPRPAEREAGKAGGKTPHLLGLPDPAFGRLLLEPFLLEEGLAFVVRHPLQHASRSIASIAWNPDISGETWSTEGRQPHTFCLRNRSSSFR